MNYSNEIELDHERFVDATVNVMNASHLKTKIEVRGFSGIEFGGYGSHARKAIKPRSYAFICTQKDAKEKSQQKLLIEHGAREANDFLVHYRQINSSNGRLSIDFHDPHLKLTYILVRVNVRTFYFRLEKKIDFYGKFLFLLIRLVTMGNHVHQ